MSDGPKTDGPVSDGPESRDAGTVIVLADENRTVAGTITSGQVAIAADDLFDAIGWTRKPEGLCRGDVCVPVSVSSVSSVSSVASVHTDATDATDQTASHPDTIDLVAVAAALDRPVVVDADAGVIAIGVARSARRRVLEGHEAPSVTLPDLMGVPRSLDEWTGQRRVIVAFSSWCGCRYDLPGWQELQDELAGDGLQVIGVALDESADDVIPFTDEVRFPVLLDREHVMSELYAISNVPTVVWVDEHDIIARPNTYAFGSDVFKDFHGVSAEPHKQAVRRWVRDGVDPVSADAVENGRIADLSDDEIEARLWFRVGAWLRRCGRPDEATIRFEKAIALAPLDFTVHRAAMPLMGDDPFGPTFMALYEEWTDAGMPYHGLPADSVEAPQPREQAVENQRGQR